MSVKDRTVLAPMASLKLCTDRMPRFMGPDKTSSFSNYYVEQHPLLHVVLLLFGGRMRPRTKTSSREQ
jgi:hypothetical protein